MEEMGSRRVRALPRPESSASSITRMTPSSSNSSTAHLPQRVQDLTARGVSGSLLQDRLRERKVESTRQNRRMSIDMGDPDRAVQSSPVRGAREERRPSSSGIVPGNMGVKQIEDAVSTLHKQNFDLKLELYHRRQRQEALEARLEALEKQVEEHEELQDVNDQLLAELEKRDQALDEAVGIIVNLEERISGMEQDRENVKTFDANYEPEYFPSQGEDFSSSPPQFEKALVRKKINRMPSFLSETTEGNDALRSLYLPPDSESLPKLLEERDGMDSPRLSILSESSFISVYGNKEVPRLTLDDADEEPQRRRRLSASVEKWVDERVPTATPQRALPSLRKTQYLSINDVLESPLQRLEKLKHTLEKTERGLSSARNDQQISIRDKRKSREIRPVFTDKNSFERQHTLPPTPDTISTNTLRGFRNSNDTLNENHANDSYTSATHQAFQSTLSIRPRSAGETVTSRREGHGWDTASQEGLTDAGTETDTLSTYSRRHPRNKHSVAPDLFSFGSRDWGYQPPLPTHSPAARYEALRRSSVDQHPRSDNTVTTYNRYDDSPPYGTIPIDTTPKPDMPDRRSSLSAVTKLRKSRAIEQLPVQDDTPLEQSDSGKKSRISNLHFFKRSEPSPTIPPVKSYRPQPPSRTASYAHEAQEYAEDDIQQHGQARATPPPIKRNRPSQQAHYPASSTGGQGRRGPSYGYGYDGTNDEMPVQAQGEGKVRRESVSAASKDAVLDGAVTSENGSGEGNAEGAGGKGKKWFGLGRSNSSRK